MTNSNTVKFIGKHVPSVSLTSIRFIIFPPAIVDTGRSFISRSYIFAHPGIRSYWILAIYGKSVSVIRASVVINNSNFSSSLHSCPFKIVIILQRLQILTICFGGVVFIPVPCIVAVCTCFIDHIQNCSFFCLPIFYRNAHWRCFCFCLYIKRNRQKQKHSKTNP